MKLQEWWDIQDDFGDTLVLGNGASVAVHEGFEYRSLRKTAEKEGFLSEQVREVFEQLGTDDFELVTTSVVTAASGFTWHSNR